MLIIVDIVFIKSVNIVFYCGYLSILFWIYRYFLVNVCLVFLCVMYGLVVIIVEGIGSVKNGFYLV